MAGDFEVRFDDAFRFATRMAQAPQIVGEEMTRSVDRITLQGERYTKVETPVATGDLRRSIAMKPAVFAGGVVTGRWGTSKPYAPMVEEGRGPIVASGKALVFKPHPKYGIPVKTKGKYKGFAVLKRVKPAAGHHMFQKALGRVRPLVGREMAAGVRRIVERMGGA